MSVVAVKVHDNNIEFAADSIGIRGGTKNTNITKLAEINQMIIGGVGELQELNLLFIFAQTHSPLESTEKAIMDFFFEFCKWKKDLSLGFDCGNNYLFGYKGKAFLIQNLLVKEVQDYEAIGAGMDYSLAALYLNHSAKEAVKVACALSCYVAEPITIIKMPLSEEKKK